MHTLTNRIYRLTPLLLCFFCALQAWSVEDVALPPVEAPPAIHVVVKGEKLSDLAEKYLGHKRYAPELLRYNDVDNPRQITAGYVLSIPGPERKRCVDRLAELEQRIKQVEPLALKTYATGEYKIAFQMLESARKQLANTGYARGIKYCELADEALDLAIKAGRLAEIAEQTWVVESIFGEVHVSNDNQANWKRVQVGQKLAPKSILRTGGNSKVAVKFHDGSRVELEENSMFSATRIVRSNRTGKSNARFKLLRGEMLGEIIPLKDKDATIDLESQNASIAIRGSRFRMSSDPTHTKVAVLEGHVIATQGRLPNFEQVLTQGSAFYLKAIQAQNPLRVKTQQGVKVVPGHKMKISPLLPAPVPRGRYAKDTRSVLQQLDLNWKTPGKVAPAQYLVEVAFDKDFYQPIMNLLTAELNLRTPSLKQGDYFWRVSSINNEGLRGTPSGAISIRIRPNFDFEFKAFGPIKEIGNTFSVGPNTTIHLQPQGKNTTVQRFLYQIGEAQLLAYDQPITFSKEGLRTLTAQAIAEDGSIGQQQQTELLVDLTPPMIRLGVTSADAYMVDLSAEDPHGVKSIEYRMGKEGPFQTYTSAFNVSRDQKEAVVYRATDELGNVSREFRWTPAAP